MKKRNAKLIVKDASGQIIQLLPEIQIDNELNEDSNFPVANNVIAEAIQNIKYVQPVSMTDDSIDVSLGSVFTKTLESNTTFTIANAPSGKAYEFILFLTNGGAYQISWPNSISWTGGSAPDLKSNGTDILRFATADGTTWHGSSSAVSASDYVGATANDAGIHGLVPAATTSDKDKFLKGDGTWAVVSTAKEVNILSVEPTTSNTSAMDNEGLVFWSEGTTAGQAAGSPVLLSGNQTVEGQKKFLGGLYGGVYTMGASEWAIDLTKATCFTKTATASGTFSFTNVPEATACCITLILVNGGNYTVHWPASVKWSENETPTLTQNGTDVFTFVTCTGGNVWYGTTTCIGVTA